MVLPLLAPLFSKSQHFVPVSTDLPQHHIYYGLTLGIYSFMVFLSAPYFFPKSALRGGENLFQELPYSHKSYNCMGENFHHKHQATLTPTILTSIFKDVYDHVTTSIVFSNNKNCCRKNITMEHLSGAGHFSWLNVFEDIRRLLVTHSKKVLVDDGS